MPPVPQRLPFLPLSGTRKPRTTLLPSDRADTYPSPNFNRRRDSSRQPLDSNPPVATAPRSAAPWPRTAAASDDSPAATFTLNWPICMTLGRVVSPCHGQPDKSPRIPQDRSAKTLPPRLLPSDGVLENYPAAGRTIVSERATTRTESRLSHLRS